MWGGGKPPIITQLLRANGFNPLFTLEPIQFEIRPDRVEGVRDGGLLQPEEP